MKHFRIKYFIILVITGFGLSAQLPQNQLCDVFPSATIPLQEPTNAVFDTINTLPVVSPWAISFSESEVFNSLMTYQHPIDASKSYTLKFGKGGQVYSFINNLGEIVPPQWRNSTSAYGTDYAPWVDEVWQLVAVDISLNNPGSTPKYYIHQAGVYIKDTAVTKSPFYSPQVAHYWDAQNQTFTTVNWGQQAHIDDNLTANFRSDVLYYTQYKNLGGGLIQIDYLLYNFGNDTISYINLPWGGVRRSVYEYWFISDTLNNYQEGSGLFRDNLFGTDTTNGWVAFSTDSLGNGETFTVIVNKNNDRIRVGDAGQVSNRNYTVYTAAQNGIAVTFGKAYRVRNYFLLGSSVADVQQTVSNLNIEGATFTGFASLASTPSQTVKYSFSQHQSQLQAQITLSPNSLELAAQPFQNSYPLFMLQGFDGNGLLQTRVTHNLYTYSTKPYDGKFQNAQLLGYTSQKTAVSFDSAMVCLGDSFRYADGYTVYNIDSVQHHFSNLGVDSNGVQQILHTYLKVDTLVNCSLSLKYNLKKDGFDLYPNPTKDYVKFNKVLQHVCIYSLHGKLMLYHKKTTSLDISSLPAGIYTVTAISNNQTVKQKLIKL